MRYSPLKGKGRWKNCQTVKNRLNYHSSKYPCVKFIENLSFLQYANSIYFKTSKGLNEGIVLFMYINVDGKLDTLNFS